MKVADLTKDKKAMTGKQGHTLVKDLLKGGMAKSGKLKTVKLKMKFGSDKK